MLLLQDLETLFPLLLQDIYVSIYSVDVVVLPDLFFLFDLLLHDLFTFFTFLSLLQDLSS